MSLTPVDPAANDRRTELQRVTTKRPQFPMAMCFEIGARAEETFLAFRAPRVRQKVNRVS
jgi:hypothetical protein